MTTTYNGTSVAVTAPSQPAVTPHVATAVGDMMACHVSGYAADGGDGSVSMPDGWKLEAIADVTAIGTFRQVLHLFTKRATLSDLGAAVTVTMGSGYTPSGGRRAFMRTYSAPYVEIMGATSSTHPMQSPTYSWNPGTPGATRLAKGVAFEILGGVNSIGGWLGTSEAEWTYVGSRHGNDVHLYEVAAQLPPLPDLTLTFNSSNPTARAMAVITYAVTDVPPPPEPSEGFRIGVALGRTGSGFSVSS